MDPFTIVCTVAQTVTSCFKITQILIELRSKYDHASLMIGSICSELAVTTTFLSQIQGVIASSRAQVAQDVLQAFDIALMGCVVTISALEDEIKGLQTIEPGLDSFTWKQKTKTVWKDTDLKEILQHMRGQANALNMLLQTFQTTSLRQIEDRLESLAPLLELVVRGTRSLRSSRPSVRAPESFFSTELDDDARTNIASLSIAESEDVAFDFDDIVVDAEAYRRVIRAARRANRDVERPRAPTRFQEQQGIGLLPAIEAPPEISTFESFVINKAGTSPGSSEGESDDEINLATTIFSNISSGERAENESSTSGADATTLAVPEPSKSESISNEASLDTLEALDAYTAMPGKLQGVGEVFKRMNVRFTHQEKKRAYRVPILPIRRKPVKSETTTEDQGVGSRNKDQNPVIGYVVVPDKEAATDFAAFHAENRNAALNYKPAVVDEYDITSWGSTNQTILLRLTDEAERLQHVITDPKTAESIRRLLDALSLLNNYITTYGGQSNCGGLQAVMDKLYASKQHILQEFARRGSASDAEMPRRQKAKMCALRIRLDGLVRDVNDMIPQQFEVGFRDYMVEKQKMIGF